mmetsp:Transcript_18147/g.51802  ORF Transcript_18147/g.51802 Transcript_18147/m.51802 type:complete len:406 (-) Transcript_18147:1496-2713(-)
MLLDFLRTSCGRPETELGRALEEAGHDADAGLVRDVARERKRGFQDFSEEVQLVLGIPAEWQRTDDELMHHHAERPPIDRASVPLAEDRLWREVLRRADEGVGAHGLLAAAHVHQLGVPFEVEEHVLRLQIPVHDASSMQVLERQSDGGAVELRLRFGQVADLADGVEQVASAEELGQEVHILAVLEGFDELHDARVVALSVDVALDHDGLLLPLLHHLLLADTLQGVQPLFVLLVVAELHHAEGSATNDGLQAQVPHGDVQVLHLHAVQELLAETADDVSEYLLVQTEACARLIGAASGRALLGEEECALAEVVPSAEGAEWLPVFHDLDRAGLDQPKVTGVVALANDVLPRLELPLLQRPNGPLDLLVRQVLEQEDVAQHLLDLVQSHYLLQGRAQRLGHHLV